MRVVIVGGAGGVGSSLAHNLLLGPRADEIVLIDAREPTAQSHAMDFEQLAELGTQGSVRVGGDDEIAGADIVVISASTPLRANASRLESLHDNAAIVGRFADVVAAQDPGWPGVVVMVTNPVDPLVMAFAARAGLGRDRILGYTLNDSLRLRTGIARAIGSPPGSVEAWVIGEHGDGAVALFGRVTVDGVPRTLSHDEQAAALDYQRGWYLRNVSLDPTRTSTWTSGRGVAQLIDALAADEPTLIPASVLLDGEYGLRDVSLTVPVMAARGGVAEIVEWQLTDVETTGLRDAADIVRAAAAQLSG